MKCPFIIATTVISSLISFNIYSQVPEIITLKKNARLPHSVFQNNSVNEVAESLVLRKHRLQEKNQGGKIDYSGRSQIYLSFNSAHTESIIKDGELLNAHQTSQGATFHDDLLLRAQLEDAMLGVRLDYSSEAKRLRPKYAYLQPIGLTGYPLTTFNPNYGNIFAKVNDRLKVRSTFTIGDSMDEGKETLHTFYFKDPIKLKHETSKIAYWETQIWGDLKLVDIDFFLVNCPGFPKAAQSDVEKLFESGIKTYFCSLDQHRQNLAPAKAVTKEDLQGADFLNSPDKTVPIIRKVVHQKNEKGLSIKIEASDNVGLNYCLIKAYHGEKLLLDDEISIRENAITSKTCQFHIASPRYPLELKIFVKDWYTNQATAKEMIK